MCVCVCVNKLFIIFWFVWYLYNKNSKVLLRASFFNLIIHLQCIYPISSLDHKPPIDLLEIYVCFSHTNFSTQPYQHETRGEGDWRRGGDEGREIGEDGGREGREWRRGWSVYDSIITSLTSSFSILASFINRTSSCTSKLKRGPMKVVK